MKISAVISVYNGEDTIEKCLESVKWVDEIILVNCSSTDKTVEKAKKYTSKIYTRENNLMLNINKNFGFEKATGEWVLNLDSDEKVSKELALEIKELLKDQPKVDGFLIPRKNIIFGKWIEHTGWYPDHQLRLFRKGKGKFEEKHVHELIKVDGKVSNIKNHIIHDNFRSISQFIEKTYKIYAPNEAENLIKKGYDFNWRDAIKMPVNEFLSRFFAREGYKDGFHGFMLSMLMAFYHLIILGLIWEKENFKEVNENILQESHKEFNKGYKDLSHWFLKKESLSFPQKLLTKIKNKLI